MAKITEITLQRYGCIKSLHLDNLKRVNVLIGSDNCGKTSLLEAILILIAEPKPYLPIGMNFTFTYWPENKNDIAFIFHNFDTSVPIHIAAKFDDNMDRDLYIKYYEKSENVNLSDSAAHAINTEPILHSGLNFEYKLGDAIFNSNIEFCKGDSVKKFSISKKENTPSPKAVYITPCYNFDDAIRLFNKIISEKEKVGLIKALRCIEPNIKDVVVEDNVVMVDVGLQMMIPMNFFVKEIRILFYLIIAMYDARGGILLIDDAEDDIYYTTMEVLWKILLNASKELNVQVFVTAQSSEVLVSLNSILKNELKDSQSDVNIYTLPNELS